MTPAKRIFDLALALALLPLALPLLLVLLVLLVLLDGRPLFYVSERMKTPTQGFWLIKLRTMRPAAPGQNTGVSGGDKHGRISGFGAVLRRTHLDEIPQLWNILSGDLSFVGPRPPLRRYVERFPTLYGGILRNRPGLTGLATIVFHRHEDRLLAACKTADETEDIYQRRCIARKARLDLIYQQNRRLALDLWVLGKTAARLKQGLSLKSRQAFRDDVR